MEQHSSGTTKHEQNRLLGIEQRLLGRLRERCFAPGSQLIVGFSGGVDSLALATALSRLKHACGINPLLAHVDHGLRPESRTEQERASRLASRLDLPFLGLLLPDHPRRLHSGVGLEEAARRERYRLLTGLYRESGACALVLAHQRDDQAETVLLHLLRGAGLAGARGMTEWSERRVPWWDDPESPTPLRVWRPLLEETRAELASYVAGRGLAPIADPSNDDRRHRRNAVRHEVLPGLEAAFPGATAALARFGRLVADDDDALDTWARRLCEAATAPDGTLKLALVAGEPPAVTRRAIRAWLGMASGGRIEPTAERIEALRERVEHRAGGRIEVGGGWSVIVAAGRLRVEHPGGG